MSRGDAARPAGGRRGKEAPVGRAAMGEQRPEDARGPADDVDAYVARYYAFHPHQAIWDGRHEHDGRVPDFGRAAVRDRILELERWGVRLPTPPTSGPLPTQDARDRALVEYARA